MSKIKIEHWPVDNVLPYAKNARLHSPEQIATIASSMKQFGFVNPALVDANGVLIAGHGRILGAKSIGMETVPVIRLGHLDETKANALRIFDNSSGLQSTWDTSLLQSELDKLEEMNFDLASLALDKIELPELDNIEPQEVTRRTRSKTTIFLSVKNEIADKARKVVVAALNKAGIDHNL